MGQHNRSLIVLAHILRISICIAYDATQQTPVLPRQTPAANVDDPEDVAPTVTRMSVRRASLTDMKLATSRPNGQEVSAEGFRRGVGTYGAGNAFCLPLGRHTGNYYQEA